MNAHKVQFVYLIPSDKTNVAEQNITNTALHLQCWYRWQMGNGKSFTLANPIVQVHTTPHDSNWYGLNHNGDTFAGYFWNNVLADAAALADVGFYQIFNDYVVYIDAQPLAGQYVGGTSGVNFPCGVAVLPMEDVHGVPGCRWIGGCGHELGHTFGLPHPDGDPNWNHDLMGSGYLVYPNDVLTQPEKDQLNTNPFFDFITKPVQPNGICSFDDNRPTPHPRPAPTPHPRPNPN